MLRTGLFVDTSNLYYCLHKKYPGRKLDYSTLLTCFSHYIVHKHAYGVRKTSEARNFITSLKNIGFEVRFIKKQNFKRPNLNIDLAMDVVRCADKLDIVTLCTSDRDIEPLIRWLKEKGVKVNVVACGIPTELKLMADECTEIPEEMLEEKDNGKTN